MLTRDLLNTRPCRSQGRILFSLARLIHGTTRKRRYRSRFQHVIRNRHVAFFAPASSSEALVFQTFALRWPLRRIRWASDTWADTTSAHGGLMRTFPAGQAEFEREANACALATAAPAKAGRENGPRRS
jgi:hypothetical protein